MMLLFLTTSAWLCLRHSRNLETTFKLSPVYAFMQVSMSGIRKVAGKGLKGMEALVNMKTLRNGTNVIQLETHIATPIKFFEHSRAATYLHELPC